MVTGKEQKGKKLQEVKREGSGGVQWGFGEGLEKLGANLGDRPFDPSP